MGWMQDPHDQRRGVRGCLWTGCLNCYRYQNNHRKDGPGGICRHDKNSFPTGGYSLNQAFPVSKEHQDTANLFHEAEDEHAITSTTMGDHPGES